MPWFGTGRRNPAFRVMIAGAALTVLTTFSGPGVALARTDLDVNGTAQTGQNQPAFRPLSTMNGAVSTGQFEELVKPTPVPTPAPTVAPTPVPTAVLTQVARKPALFETGVASTYGEGDGFEGNLTACGQVFHTNVIQVAHKTLPCGTMIRIEDRDTGLSVDAEVTDRGPYIQGRIVDLSWGAFRQLDPTGPGLLRVSVYLLD